MDPVSQWPPVSPTPASALHRPTGEKYRQTVELRIDTVSVFEGRWEGFLSYSYILNI